MKKNVVVILILSVLADRITKFLALFFLTSEPTPVCYGVNLLLTWNRGVSWGLGAHHGVLGYWLLTTVICLLIAGFGFFVRQRIINNLSVGWETLVLGGAISNLFDRFNYGAVIDFVELYYGSFYWPVFNVADILIIVGMCGIFLRFYKRENI